MVKEYPGFGSTEGEETVDFPFHGAGRKSVRHKYPTGEGELVVNVYVCPARGDDDHPRVLLDVAHNFGPAQYVRFNPGRADYSETVVPS